MKSESHYTFGDGDVAQDRLRLLAQVFEPSSRALLAELPPPANADPGLGVDLGCGAGYTTELVCALPGLGRVVGLDRSALPLPPARLLYARFLLTHLRDVTRVLVGWKAAVAPGGLVVLEETAHMRSPHRAFARYYALVERMQAHYGQAMYIGRSLDEAARLAGLRPLLSRVAELELPAERMARLHALNIETWKDDAFARGAFDAAELEALGATLAGIARAEELAPPVACGVRQLVLRPS